MTWRKIKTSRGTERVGWAWGCLKKVVRGTSLRRESCAQPEGGGREQTSGEMADAKALRQGCAQQGGPVLEQVIIGDEAGRRGGAAGFSEMGTTAQQLVIHVSLLQQHASFLRAGSTPGSHLHLAFLQACPINIGIQDGACNWAIETRPETRNSKQNKMPCN